MSAYRELKFRIIGVVPLLMHNGQTADPLNPHSKSIAEITSKRKKTDADHREVARREWYAGLYLMDGEPCIPAEVIEAALVRGAMKLRRGPAAKAGLLVEENCRLHYDGPRKPDDLWKEERFRLRVPVKIGASRVTRTRPRFENWSAEVVAKFLPSLLNEKDILTFATVAGEQEGIGDWRPRFGRFLVEEIAPGRHGEGSAQPDVARRGLVRRGLSSAGHGMARRGRPRRGEARRGTPWLGAVRRGMGEGAASAAAFRTIGFSSAQICRH